MSPREKRTLPQRIRRNLKHLVPRPLRFKTPRQFSAEELEDLEQFTGLPAESLLPYLRRERGKRISDELAWLDPQSAPEYAWFYRGSRTYLFATDPAWERAAELAGPGMRCLDFGGGCGRNSLGMAEKGAKVFYVDIGVLNGAFTAFRARKRGLTVTLIDPMVEVDGRWVVDTAEAARQVGGFDLVVADNVLEHVKDYHRVVAKLAQALSPTGRILECTPFRREKAYLWKQEKEWSKHLPPSMPMSEAMDAAGMRPVAGEPGLWECRSQG